jgi:hypothetical protein
MSEASKIHSEYLRPSDGIPAGGRVGLDTRQIIAKWPLPDAHVAHAIALDEPNHRLFTTTRKPRYPIQCLIGRLPGMWP